MGYQFNRQFPMILGDLKIIVDFICRKLKLVIEIDGYSHKFKVEKDRKRDLLLQNEGYTVLRVSEHDVVYDFNNVIRVIENLVHELEKESPRPPFTKGEE